jgi:hypothetical protein
MIKILLISWAVVFIIFFSWVAQYFYYEWKNKKK